MLIYVQNKFIIISNDKLGLNWPKLRSDWNWDLVQIKFVAQNCLTKLKVVSEYNLIANY